ncbi:MAG: hypothetical protein R3D51_00745 [Hyphomicrobiaceae bacterium]
MPRVTFGSAIQRHVAIAETVVAGGDVRTALDEVFNNNPRARSYVLDDQNALRKHMNIFVDGRAITDRRTLSDETSPTSHIYVVQALSGG